MAAVCLWAVAAAAVPVAVIHGSVSVPEGERRFAASLASHVERWFKESGVETAAADDGSLATALAGKKVAVLVYMASPNARQVAALSDFVGRGGKLIICYSSSQELAALMGMKTVGYLKGSTDGRWSQMRFEEDRPKGVPASILQTSQNLFVVAPVEGRSRVLAWWHDRAGAQTSEPAWLSSRNGCWMTHVLLADGDAEAKGRLLLALAASYDESLWKSAAAQVLRQGHALEKVVQSAMARGNTARAAKAWETLEGVSRGAGQSLAEGKAFEAWNAALEVKARCYEVYGLLQPTRKGEIRAVWDRSGMGLYPGQWARTCRLLKDAGISDLYVNVAGAGFAHFGSGVLPRSKVFDEQGDQLAACLAAAKPLGLRVHAWMFCFSTDGATAERIAIFKRKGWVLSDETAKPWLDPASPEVRAYLVKAVRELATNPKLDGVHLDFVRYPDFISCFGPGVKQRFEKDSGRVAADWPEDVKTGALRQMFIQWRAKQVSDFVQDARREMKRSAPGKLLTAAVYGKYPSCLDAVGQDWESWVNIGLVDYVVPMDYTEDFSKFGEWLAAQTRTRKQAMRVVPGIGVTAAESRLDAIQVIDQIQASRRAGCPGFALFDLDTTLRQEILPVLRMGVTDGR
jgi:uncharacterized lipoprotein YddW (UPF0748 family)